MSGATIAGIVLASVAVAAAVGVLTARRLGAFKSEAGTRPVDIVAGNTAVAVPSASLYAAIPNPVSKAKVQCAARIPQRPPTGISFRLG
jgi:hypothetical protein